MNVGDKRLLAGRVLILVVGIIFIAFSAFVVVTPLRGEEEYVGMTFRELQSVNSNLASVVWHYTAAIGVIAFGVNLFIVVLAWKEFSRGTTLAWYSILLLTLTFAAALIIAHVPIRHPSFAHWGMPTILTFLYLVGLAISARPVLSKQQRNTGR